MKARILACGLLLVASTWRLWMGEPVRSHGHDISHWVARLDSPQPVDYMASREVIEALGDFGPRGGPAVPALMRALEKPESHPLWVLEALGKIGPAAAAAIPAIVPLLRPEKPLDPPPFTLRFIDQTSFEARETLVRIGPAAVPSLNEALRSEDALMRVNAAWAVWKIQRNLSALPVIASVFNDSNHDRYDMWIRKVTADALGDIGRVAPDAVLPILDAAVQREPRTAYHAVSALQVMAPVQQQALDRLFALLVGTHDENSRFAGMALRPVGEPVVHRLLLLLHASDPEQRRRAVWVLGFMEEGLTDTALRALRKATGDPDAKVREMAGWGLDLQRQRHADHVPVNEH
jgi:HEAT repeat protein